MSEEVLERAYVEAERYRSEGLPAATERVVRQLQMTAIGEDVAASERAIQMAERFLADSDRGRVPVRDSVTEGWDTLDAVVLRRAIADVYRREILQVAGKAPRPNPASVRVHPAYRAMWFALVVVGIVWGVLAGFSLAGESWLDPASAIFGILAIGVLSLTVNKIGSRAA